MSIVHRIAQINPALIIIIAAILYGVVLFVRSQFLYLLLSAVAALALSLMLLPGGKALIKQTETLRDPVDKSECVAVAVADRAPWGSPSAVNSISQCRYRGAALGSGAVQPSAAQSQAAAQLTRMFGGKPEA